MVHVNVHKKVGRGGGGECQIKNTTITKTQQQKVRKQQKMTNNGFVKTLPCGTKPIMSRWLEIRSGVPFNVKRPEVVPYPARSHKTFMKEVLPAPLGPITAVMVAAGTAPLT